VPEHLRPRDRGVAISHYWYKASNGLFYNIHDEIIYISDSLAANDPYLREYGSGFAIVASYIGNDTITPQTYIYKWYPDKSYWSTGDHATVVGSVNTLRTHMMALGQRIHIRKYHEWLSLGKWKCTNCNLNSCIAVCQRPAVKSYISMHLRDII
jgi:hypothetical protein